MKCAKKNSPALTSFLHLFPYPSMAQNLPPDSLLLVCVFGWIKADTWPETLAVDNRLQLLGGISRNKWIWHAVTSVSSALWFYNVPKCELSLPQIWTCFIVTIHLTANWYIHIVNFWPNPGKTISELALSLSDSGLLTVIWTVGTGFLLISLFIRSVFWQVI